MIPFTFTPPRHLCPPLFPFQSPLSELHALLREKPSVAITQFARSLPDVSTKDSRVLSAAHDLYACGLNVFPVPRVGMEHNGGKPPYADTRRFETARLHPPLFRSLFRDSNIAVLVGRMSGNLFVLDCDSSQAYDWVKSELDKRGLWYWASQGARGGHFWLRCAEGVVRSCKPQSDIDVKGNSGYVVAPPSVHPTGVIYEWVYKHGDGPPVVSVSDLDFLSLEVEHRRKGELPFVAHKVLVENDRSDYGKDASAAEFAAVLSLTRAGYGDEEIVAVFEQYNPPHFAGQKSPVEWLRRYMLPKANEIIATSSSSAPQHRPHAARDWALAQPWPGRGGMSDRAVFLALCHRAEQERREPFRASLRELTERANVDKKTVLKALERLISAGHIKRHGAETTSGAMQYSLTPSHSPRTSPTMRSSPCIRSGGGWGRHDVWHYSTLGKTGQVIWSLLLEADEMTEAEIAKATGRGIETVRRKLVKLEHWGLVLHIGHFWQGLFVEEHILDSIAMQCGTQGRTEARRQQHESERSQWMSALLLRQKEQWNQRQQQKASPGMVGCVLPASLLN